jgi:chorismate-pyruvate lyase
MATKQKSNQPTEAYIVTGWLHTEVLQDIYGPICVKVLKDDNLTREVLLTDQQNIARTYALTIKNDEWAWNKEMQLVNAAIRSGEAIGKTFKTNGFSICKNIIDVYLVNLPEWLQQAFEHTSSMAKARISEFLVKKNELIFNYGLITEIYSPDFRNATINAQDSAQINLPSCILYDMGLTKQQVWKYIEDKALCKNKTPGYISFITDIKEKVDKRLG